MRANKTNELSLKWLFFSRHGRIARKSFIFACLFLMIVLTFIVWQIVKVGDNEDLLASWGLVLIIFGLLSTYCLFCLTLKRLNDLSLPWYFVAGIFVPTLNYIFLGVLMFLPSKDETNRHGPPPFKK